MSVIKAFYSGLFFSLLLLSQSRAALADSFEPDPGQGEPNSTAGGASRPVSPACLSQPNQSASLTVLAPKTYLGLTTQARPTFWVHLPPTKAKTLEFSLFDRQRKGIYQVNVAIAGSTGLTPITLPETAPALSLDRPYYWTVALVCNPKRRTEDWVADGWIQRQQPNAQLQQSLALTSTNLDRAKLYIRSNFWYDAISDLINLQQKPQNSAGLTELWSKAFAAAGVPKVNYSSTSSR